jgi:hypothetical protein
MLRDGEVPRSQRLPCPMARDHLDEPMGRDATGLPRAAGQGGTCHGGPRDLAHLLAHIADWLLHAVTR